MAHPSSLRLLALHALRLKGTASPDAVAELTGYDATMVDLELAALADLDLVTYRHGGFAGYVLTPEGRALAARLVAEELAEVGAREAVEGAYQRFRACNDEVLDVCTAWQVRPDGGRTAVNDHRDPDYDRSVIARLVEGHHRAEPVLESLAAILERFAGHQRRLRTALDKVLAGDHDHFTKPMFPSYHSHWFELHEDLLVTLGIERATEGSR